MKGIYLLAYVFTLNGTTDVGSADVTLEQDQPITPEVIRDAIRKIREGCGRSLIREKGRKEKMTDTDMLYMASLEKRNEELEVRISVLEGKHWNECGQIAHYSDENAKLKELLKEAVDDFQFLSEQYCEKNCACCPMAYIENKTLQFAEVKPDFYCAAGETTEKE